MSITRAQRARFHDYAPTPEDIDAALEALDTATARLSEARATKNMHKARADRAEHRATRAEAQSETRRLQIAYLQGRVQALRDLHESDEHGAGCGERDCFPSCLECDEDYPCKTIRALDGTVTPGPQ